MATSTTIRERLEGIMRRTLTAGNFRGSASGWPTEKVGGLPHAQLGFDDDRITMGDVEVHIHTIDLSVLVERKGQLEQELIRTDQVKEAMLAAVRVNQSLPDADGVALEGVERITMDRAREAIVTIAGVDYIGFVGTLTVKEDRYVTLLDEPEV